MTAEDDDDMLPEKDYGGKPLQEWLAREFGPRHPIARDATSAHGLVHRLDRDTSGALVWACSYSGYYAARMQFAARRVQKRYVCLCHGRMPLTPQLLEAKLQKTMRATHGLRSVVTDSGRPARTEVAMVCHLVDPDLQVVSLVQVSLHTGRLHQIRAHLGNRGHPLVGDTAYGGSPCSWCSRMLLHAHRLCLDIGDGPIVAEPPVPAGLRGALGELWPSNGFARVVLQLWTHD